MSASNAARKFVQTFGYEPTGVWSAPGRVNLIGEYTDFNGGFVLPLAIDRRTYAAIGVRSDGLMRVASDLFPDAVEVQWTEQTRSELTGWWAYPLGVVHVLQETTDAQCSGLDIFLTSDVPTGSGLSSSAAVECAVAIAVNELWETGLSQAQIARICQRAENTVVGAPTGFMDQYASMLGEQGAALYLDCTSERVDVVPLGLEDYELLVMDTNETHSHSTGGYAARRASCERAAEIMGVPKLREADRALLEEFRTQMDDETYRRARHIVTENERVVSTVAAFASGNLQGVGELFAQSQASMKYDFEISTPALDLAVATALSHGAVASRVTGGGFGGAAIAIVPSERRSLIEARVTESFLQAGLGEPNLFTVHPSRGAEREM